MSNMENAKVSVEGSYEDLGGDSNCEAFSDPLDVKPLQVQEPVCPSQ